MAEFLFQYRITPHTTGVSSAELFLGRNLRSHLSFLLPGVEKKVKVSKRRQKKSHDRGSKEREFRVGDRV